MNRHAAPTPGVFHFLQHNTVPPQAWHSFCQAVTLAYLRMREYPDMLGLTTAPVICEHTGNRPLRYDDSVIGLGMVGFNGDRATHQAGGPFLLYRRQTPHALIRCDTRGYPYQWLVVATLLLANTYSPNTWTIESDVPLKQWHLVAHWLAKRCQLPVSPLKG